MDVLIVETKTGKVVAKLPVVLQGMNYTPSEQEYFTEAWRCAADDKTVDSKRRDEYSFQLVRPE
jgi:hypothetical protein